MQGIIEITRLIIPKLLCEDLVNHIVSAINCAFVFKNRSETVVYRLLGQQAFFLQNAATHQAHQ